jgi:hypothetical protein
MFYFLLDRLSSPTTISYFWSSSKGRRAHMVAVEMIYKTSNKIETLSPETLQMVSLTPKSVTRQAMYV